MLELAQDFDARRIIGFAWVPVGAGSNFRAFRYSTYQAALAKQLNN